MCFCTWFWSYILIDRARAWRFALGQCVSLGTLKIRTLVPSALVYPMCVFAWFWACILLERARAWRFALGLAYHSACSKLERLLIARLRLVAGVWLLVAACWLLLAGCWLLLAESRACKITCRGRQTKGGPMNMETLSLQSVVQNLAGADKRKRAPRI